MNKKSFIWLIPVLVLTLALSACGGSDEDDSTENLSLSGTVRNYEDNNIYLGTNITFSSNVGGSGNITDGKMSFSVGAPTSRLVPIQQLFTSMLGEPFNTIFARASYSAPETNAQNLEFSIGGSPIFLIKAYINETDTATTMQQVTYIYADKDCTVTAKNIDPVTISGIPINVSDLNLSLTKGWNYINVSLVSKSPEGNLAISKGDLTNCEWLYSNSSSY